MVEIGKWFLPCFIKSYIENGPLRTCDIKIVDLADEQQDQALTCMIEHDN